MSKTIERELTKTEYNELLDRELDTVTGGVSDLGKSITKAVDDAISVAIAGSAGSPDVWVGFGWVPGRW